MGGNMKTIIEMAREAGAVTTSQFTDVGVELFAELVRADEREACAKVCDVLSDTHSFEGCYADECAAAIRARGNT
jgi:hypothetical protein